MFNKSMMFLLHKETTIPMQNKVRNWKIYVISVLKNRLTTWYEVPTKRYHIFTIYDVGKGLNNYAILMDN